MKKIFSICLIFCLIALTGCKKETVTTVYTVGCVAFSSGNNTSDWARFERYMKSVVTYNNSISYTHETADENDAEAIKYYDEQIAKINPDSACKYIHNGDYLIYGVAKNTDSIYVLKAKKFTASGMFDYVYYYDKK